MRIDIAALKVMKEQKVDHVWYGNPQLCHDIADRAGFTTRHAGVVTATVLSQVARSPRFFRNGSILHLGRSHNVYKPVKAWTI